MVSVRFGLYLRQDIFNSGIFPNITDNEQSGRTVQFQRGALRQRRSRYLQAAVIGRGSASGCAYQFFNCCATPAAALVAQRPTVPEDFQPRRCTDR